jgi:hypothetical protein
MVFVVLAVQMNGIIVHCYSKVETLPIVSGHLISQQYQPQANQIRELVVTSSFILLFSSALEQKNVLRYLKNLVGSVLWRRIDRDCLKALNAKRS